MQVAASLYSRLAVLVCLALYHDYIANGKAGTNYCGVNHNITDELSSFTHRPALRRSKSVTMSYRKAWFVQRR